MSAQFPPQTIYTSATARRNFRQWLKGGTGAGLITVFADSTADQTQDWVYQAALKIAARYPALRVVHRFWNDTNQNYDAEGIVQDGASGERYLRQPGGAGVTPTIPYANIGDIPAGDVTFISKTAQDDWTPAANRWFGGRWGDATHRGWTFGITSSGAIVLQFTSDGATTRTLTSTAGVGVADGSTLWCRCDLDVDNGAAQCAASFYKSTDYVTWTAVGTNPVNGAFGTITGISNPTGESGGETYAITAGGTTAGGTMTANHYKLEVRTGGLNGRNLFPVSLPDFFRTTSATDNGISINGSQTLYINNCSLAGAGLTYLTDATRIAKAMWPCDNHMVVLASGHNDTGSGGTTYKDIMTTYDTWITALQNAHPSASFVGVIENPRTAPASWQMNYNRNMQLLRSYYVRKGLDIADFYGAFNRDGRSLSLLVDPSDGVHPLAAGSIVSAQEFVAPML